MSSSHPNPEAAIAAAQQRLETPPFATSVTFIPEAGPPTSARVRLAGGYVLNASLRGHAPFFSPPEDQRKRTKLRATHAMLPVGPHDGPGGQHGAARWLEYGLLPAQDDAWSSTLRLTAAGPAGRTYQRMFTVGDGVLAITTAISGGNTALQTSVGEHNYFNHVGRVQDIGVGHGTIGDRLGDVALAELLQGKPYFLPDNTEQGVALDLNYGQQPVTLSTECTVNDRSVSPDASLGVLLWVPQDTPPGVVCIEPTAGFAGHTPEMAAALEVPSHQIMLDAADSLQFTSTLRLGAPA